MTTFSLRERDSYWKQLGQARYDILVLGGGINGAGVFRDAALRGVTVALCEQGDFASGTSSRSSKLIHGGLRYLEQHDFMLVRQSTKERARLAALAPHLVRPLPFLFPVYESGRHSLFKINMGLWLYDLLAGFHNFESHRKLKRPSMVTALEPGLKSTGLRGGALYYDAATDDARLVLENVLDGVACGGIALSRVQVTGLELRRGRIQSVGVKDLLTGQEQEVQTRCLILAAGPWTDKVTRTLGVLNDAPLTRLTKGIHVVVPRDRLLVSHAVVMLSPIDGRVMFAIPWNGATVIGTTDTDFDGDPSRVSADPADADYCLASANAYFPSASLTRADIIGTWAGLRPLVREGDVPPSQVTREHKVVAHPAGVVAVVGGKLTTFRLMAKDVLAQAARLLEDLPAHRKQSTATRPLPYSPVAHDSNGDPVVPVAVALRDQFSLEEEVAFGLAQRYGRMAPEVLKLARTNRDLLRPLDSRLPYIQAEVIFAYEHEMVLDIADFLQRRTPLFFLLPDIEQVAATVANILHTECGMSLDEVRRQVEEVKALHRAHLVYSQPSDHRGS